MLTGFHLPNPIYTMKKSLLILLFPSLLFAQPSSFITRGIGGGGALFSPAINPGNDMDMTFASDLGGLYFTHNGGHFYDVTHFTQAMTNPYSKVCFTSNQNLRYCLLWNDANYALRPAKSTDAGQTWNFLAGDTQPGEDKLFIFADYDNPNRVIWTDYNHLFLSTDGGLSSAQRWQASDFGAGILLSGVFFNGNDIWLGTNEGVLVSHNGGSTFSNANFTGIPSTERIIGFGAGKNGNLTRFFALTGDQGNVWATNMGDNYWQTIRGVYTMDNVSGAWTPAMTGVNISQDYAVYLGMADNDPNTCYIAGSTPNGEAIVMKTSDGGQHWNHTYLRTNNQNIYTGYQGYQGDLGYSWGGNALGFAVNQRNSQHVVFTDYGFIHQTLDGAQTWHQAYLNPSDENPPGAATPKKKYYHGVGMEQTTCWDIFWFDPNTIFGCFTDIKGVRSTDGGESWSFDYNGHNLNTMYRIVKHNTQALWFGANSSVHDIYETTHVTDASLAPSYKAGQVLYSLNKGHDWQVMRDFANPVIWVTTDPANNERLYAGVIALDPNIGGIWRADGISNPATATWTKLPNPAANRGRVFNIHCLKDGTLVSTWSARKSNSGSTFSDSSGVFVSVNGGQSWQKRNVAAMNYWTKDLVIDPSDPTQNTWYVCVWSGWGGPANNLGRLYRSTDRGLNWQPITAADQFLRVSSVTVDPNNSETMYLTTEANGIWVTHNKSAAQPSWQLLAAYPFGHVNRVCFNPFNTKEMWIASFGNGMRKGVESTGVKEPIQPFDARILENPVRNGAVQLTVSPTRAMNIQFELVDVQGKIVKTLGSERLDAGEHTLTFNIGNLSSGVYFLSGNGVGIGKLIVE